MDVNEINKHELGERVYNLRKEMKMSQEDFASLCGLSRPTISAIENARTSSTPDNLARIASACGVTVDYLQHGDSFSISKKIQGLLDSDKEYIRFFLNLKPEQKENMMAMIKQFYPEACH